MVGRSRTQTLQKNKKSKDAMMDLLRRIFSEGMAGKREGGVLDAIVGYCMYNPLG